MTGGGGAARVHRLRDRVDAVLVGAGTVRADDPRLTTRLPGGGGRDPLRVVLDSRLRLPPDLRMFTVSSRAPALVATIAPGGERRRRGGRVEVVRCRARGGRIDLEDLLGRLAARGVAHLLVEGGAEVHAAFLAARLVDRVLLHVAPKILGGGKDWLGGAGPPRMADALLLRGLTVRRLGEDLILSGEPAWPAAARAARSAPLPGVRRQAR